MKEIDRERFDQMKSGFEEYMLNIMQATPKEPTLGDMIEDGSLAEGMIKVFQDPEYQKHEVAFRLKMLMGDPEEYHNRGGSFTNPFGVGILPSEYHPINYARIGTYAARVYKKKKAQNRIETLRKLSKLCGDIADAFEERLEKETKLRRIQ